MAKSVGNFRTLAEVLALHDPRALRLAMLQAHYRSTMEIDEAVLAGAAAGIDRLDAFARRVGALGEPDATGQTAATDAARTAFVAAMDNDMGTPGAVAAIFDLLRKGNVALDGGEIAVAAACLATVSDLSSGLGLDLSPKKKQQMSENRALDQLDAGGTRIRASIRSGVPTATATVRLEKPACPDDSTVQQLVDERQAAREARDYAAADGIRAELADLGVELEDTPTGTIWRRTR